MILMETLHSQFAISNQLINYLEKLMYWLMLKIKDSLKIMDKDSKQN